MTRRTNVCIGVSMMAALWLLAACGSTATPAAPTSAPATVAPTVAPTAAPAATAESKTSDETPIAGTTPGEAINLTGDATAGQAVYDKDCKKCHGDQGKGGVKNAGSEDGIVPALNPLDAEYKDSDPKAFATKLDLPIENGAKPEGTSPDKEMPAYGATKKLTQQQIADVIAYVMSLNK